MKHQIPISRHGTFKPSKTETFELTINGLLTKRSELFNEARRIRERLGEITNDVNAIDRVLASLDYDGELDGIMPRERDGRVFHSGKLIRTCLDTIRKEGSATARDIAVKIIIAMGDDPNDKKYVEKIASNVSRSLRKERQRGTLRSEPGKGNGLVWKLAQSAS